MRRLPILNIRVASPCRVSWAEMQGGDRVRSCSLCDQRVFNLSSLTRDEAEALIVAHAGKLCVRYYQRADGTILLADCTYHEQRGGWLPAITTAALFGISVLATSPEEPDPSMTMEEYAGGLDLDVSGDVHDRAGGGIIRVDADGAITHDGHLVATTASLEHARTIPVLHERLTRIASEVLDGQGGKRVAIVAHGATYTHVIDKIVATVRLAGLSPMFGVPVVGAE